MKIGEFAKICDTKITILRHYDRQGLLKPEYIDRFTGYRYYSKDQIPVFFSHSSSKESRILPVGNIKDFVENKK